MKRYIIISCLSLAIAAEAQYNQSITVEGKYQPDVIKLERINTFPQQVRFQMNSEPLSCERKGVAASFSPQISTLPATSWRASHNFSTLPGYLSFGSGSWLNSTLSAGYRFIDKKDMVVGAKLQHNSTSLWKPNVSPRTSDTRMYRYDEVVGVYGGYNFHNAGYLQAAVDYHYGSFNYYGFSPIEELPIVPRPIEGRRDATVPTQALNDLAARLSWIPETGNDDIIWKLSFGLRNFGYKNFSFISAEDNVPSVDPVLAPNQKLKLETIKPLRETDFNIKAGVDFPISESTSLGFDFNTDMLFYSNPDNISQTQFVHPTSYSLVTLTPYIGMRRNNATLRLGGLIDIYTYNGKELDPYQKLHFAPSVSVDYRLNSVLLYTNLTGGSKLHTLAGNYDLDYYQSPMIMNYKPTYIPLDAEAGISVSPFAGFSLGVKGAYRIARGEYLGGWYMTSLNYYNFPLSDFKTSIDDKRLNFDYLNPLTINIQGASVSAVAEYKYKEMAALKLEGSYQPQGNSIGYFNGYDRPRVTLKGGFDLNPWSSLRLRGGAEFRGDRRVYLSPYFINDEGKSVYSVQSLAMPDMVKVNIGASYELMKNINVWLQGDNLLNRRNVLLPMLPEQGIAVTAGFGWIF